MQFFKLKNKDESPFRETFMDFEKEDSGKKCYVRLRGEESLIILRGKVGVGYTREKIVFETPEEKENHLKPLLEQIISQGYQKVDTISRQRLFVQIQYNQESENEGEEEFWDLMDLRHEIEDMIYKVLSAKALGECVASDMGFGANIIIEVWDLETGLEAIKDVLDENQLLEKTIIVQQIKRNENDWENLVLYPENYSGKLNLY